MLDRTTPDPHGIQDLFELQLHVVEHVLVVPARHAALRARRAPVSAAGTAVLRVLNPKRASTKCIRRGLSASQLRQ